MNRHLTRIIAILKLYEFDFNQFNDVTNFDYSHYATIFNDLDLNEVDKVMYNELIETVIKNKEEIDELIKKHLTNYSITSLSIVDRNIIRVAIAEMKYLKLAKNIAINEAILISKEFSETDEFASSKFNNKLLDEIGKDIDGR